MTPDTGDLQVAKLLEELGELLRALAEFLAAKTELMRAELANPPKGGPTWQIKSQ